MVDDVFSFSVDLWENDDDEYCFSLVVDDPERNTTYVFSQGAFDSEIKRYRRVVSDVKELLA